MLSHNKTLLYFPLAIFLIIPTALFLAAPPPIASALVKQDFNENTTRAAGNTYYVSKAGSNGGGQSWQTAWNELNHINWSIVKAGDTILIDGGTDGMTYDTTLSIGASGSPGSPITIERATNAGHNGIVTFFGGNSFLLPYCGQTSWTQPTRTVGDAIDMNGHSWITIEGNTWGGIKIHGYTYKTIYFSGGESNDTMRNIEAYNNGTADHLSDGTWEPDFPAVELSGVTNNLTFDRVNFHDNGQDNFQGGGGINNFTVTNSWLHYTRSMPNIPGESYNLCTHNDGLQIFGSTAGSNVTFENDIIGPGITNGVILQPTVTSLVLRNVLILDPGSNATITNSDQSAHWMIDHVTIIGQSDNLTLGGTGHIITNSIFYDGYLLLNNGVASSSNNCLWRVVQSQGAIRGQTVDPQFRTNLSAYPAHTTDMTQFPPLTTLQNGDFSPQSGSPCHGLGSAVTSISSFLQNIGAPRIVPTPKPTHTPTVAPTQNPIVIATTGSSNGEQPSNRPIAPSRQQQMFPWLWLVLGVLVLLGATTVILWFTVFAKRVRSRRIP